MQILVWPDKSGHQKHTIHYTRNTKEFNFLKIKSIFSGDCAIVVTKKLILKRLEMLNVSGNTLLKISQEQYMFQKFYEQGSEARFIHN